VVSVVKGEVVPTLKEEGLMSEERVKRCSVGDVESEVLGDVEGKRGDGVKRMIPLGETEEVTVPVAPPPV